MVRLKVMAGLSVVCLIAAVGCGSEAAPVAAGTWFEGARVIVGDGSAPIEDAAFLIDGDRFTWVGRRGEREVPAGVTRVDLTGKTVIPGLIDTHNHIGFNNIRENRTSKAEYTRANVVDHLERYAYAGVVAAMSLGLDLDLDVAYRLRDEVVPNAALFLTVGRGLAADSMAGPTQEYRLGIPRGAATESEGRARVQELKSEGVRLVKIWVDDRGGNAAKIQPNVYRAIIDEAHKNAMEVVAHIGTTSGLADMKDLLRAGVDGFAHTVRDREVDAELLAMIPNYPDVWLGSNIPDGAFGLEDLAWLSETLPPSRIEEMRGQISRRPNTAAGRPNALQCANFEKEHDAGIKVVVGTDGAAGFGTEMVTQVETIAACGLTNMEAIVAATSGGAEVLHLDDYGTVAAGKNASFVILNANPLDDMKNLRNVSDVYLRGARLDREALRQKFTAEPAAMTTQG